MRLLVLLGPPAVGKMTIGRAITERSAYRLFHNHHSIEMLLDVFDYGTPPFATLNTEIRRRVIEEGARAGSDLVFTFVCAMELQEDADYLRRLIAPYAESGGDVAFVELLAGLETRLERNRTELRLAEKKSKRDVEWSDANVRELEQHRMTSDPSVDGPGERLLAEHRTLRLDTTARTPGESADVILAWVTDR
jgi:hypothetical protein